MPPLFCDGQEKRAQSDSPQNKTGAMFWNFSRWEMQIRAQTPGKMAGGVREGRPQDVGGI